MRAIILAAGMGTRLQPLTNNTPKGLVKVFGMPMVERQIINLRENGIDDILVVTGYLSEQFDYLKEKYGIKTIHNEKYDIYNNIYTMYLVRDYLSDSYVIESDIFMNNDVIDRNLNRSTYFGKVARDFKKEWIIKSGKENKISEIVTGDSEEDIIFHGISYWTKEDAEIISKGIEDAINNEKFDDMYWDDIIIKNINNIDLYLNKLNEDDVFEIDSIKDLEKVEEILKSKVN
ncbi:sugar phosphate nucleotidyltransferase [Clostridium chrysemydis]|uniref:sugar phosphate nucleotidyltransferase n=1 Tax=Clostridium chrysemydis TaxID=2665504 RepID=UPI003F3C77BD